MMAPNERSKLLIWGFMGTGKSTVGQLAAKRARLPFVDLDAEIVNEAGETISAIFQSRGEQAFRALESEMLHRILARTDTCVVALGGGALLENDNRARALEASFVVTLTASIANIAHRIRNGDRPLLAGQHPENSIVDLLQSRQTAYQSTNAQVLTDGHPPEVVADMLLQLWPGHQSGAGYAP